MGTRPLWLIAEQRGNGLEVFTIGTDVLPVFSFREEAEMFLGFRHDADGWRARETTCGEIVSVLYGPCREVERVALDPVPGIIRLVSLSRRAFVRALLASAPTPPVVEGVGVASLVRVGLGCLFWIAVSVILSVVLTILVNLPFLF